ncbi:MAG: hypothetical protein HC936_10450, partial [Leptolyngbyaceae cyanobacterium SU_3_3]|nr:hypothetical protein [Leptolyngbyaceae cyanobacterium SU_3_3]
MGFLTQPLGHTVYKVNIAIFGDFAVYSSIGMGLFGLLLVWRGLKADELKATWMGMLGGWFLWMGWFEYSFKFYSVLYDVPGFPVETDGYVAAPQANMLQATLPIMLAILVLYGFFNQQTKCNFMRWFHRNLGFSPGMPTPDNKRSFARITAMELLFVTWFCYLFWLYAIYLGTRGTGVIRRDGSLRGVDRLGGLPRLEEHAAGTHGACAALWRRRGHRAVGFGRNAGALPCLSGILALPGRVSDLQYDRRGDIRHRYRADRTPAEASRLAVRAIHSTFVTLPRAPSGCAAPGPSAHPTASPSGPPDALAKRWPSGLKATLSTEPVCPLRV